MHSLIRNHPFIDGNKRTGFLATVVFYGLNGWILDMDDPDVIGLADRRSFRERSVGTRRMPRSRRQMAPAPSRSYGQLSAETAFELAGTAPPLSPYAGAPTGRDGSAADGPSTMSG